MFSYKMFPACTAGIVETGTLARSPTMSICKTTARLGVALRLAPSMAPNLRPDFNSEKKN